MATRFILAAALTLTVCATAFAAPLVTSNEDHVLKPLDGKTGPEKMMVFIPGANVPTENYLPTAKAIQDASDLKLWVAIPTMGPPKRCIILCPTLSTCSPLQSFVTSIITSATGQGYNGSAFAPDTFIVGHSLGGICAQRLALAYTDPPYQAAVVMGAYTEATTGAGSEAVFPVPLLTVGAELDGGQGRPGMIAVRLDGSDAATSEQTSGNKTEYQLTQKPVVILPGMDHSSFCPGFAVPGDVPFAEATEAQAMSMVGSTVSAFLSLHVGTPSAETKATALNTLAARLAWTRLLLAPLKEAYTWEAGNNAGNHTYPPMCVKAQIMLAGDAAQGKVEVQDAIYKDDSHDFEHTRTGYQVQSDGTLALNVSGHNDYYTGISTKCVIAAEDVGCKMTSSDRIAQQLKLPKNSSPNCSVVNEYILTVAEEILSKSEVGKATLARWKAKGRGIHFADDFSPFENIGPLFVSGVIKITDASDGITVSSIAIKNSVDSLIFPGVHYCKFVSPARFIDYMMIDSLKPSSGCLNV